MLDVKIFRTVVLVLCAVGFVVTPYKSKAHFSYADPRIVHIGETDDGHLVILIRMPVPLALLPADWQGVIESRVPPFGVQIGDEVFLDPGLVNADQVTFHQHLLDGLALSLDQQILTPQVGRIRFWLDGERPGFSTPKSALKSFARAAVQTPLPYFDATLDVEFILPGESLQSAIQINSPLGAKFQIMDEFGTIVKLHRETGTITAAMIGILDAESDAHPTDWRRLLSLWR